MELRKMKTAAKRLALLLLMPCIALAAPPRAEPSERNVAGRSGAVTVGQPVTPYNIKIDLRNMPKAKLWQPGMPIREAHRRQYFPIGAKVPHTPANRPTAPDRLPDVQNLWSQNPRLAARAKSEMRKRVSINNPNTGVSPGDPVVEVGANHVVYAVNGASGTYFNVYNKAGALVAGPVTFGSLAPAGTPCASDGGDPIVLYDRQAGRWFLLALDNSNLCTYVSKTSDPVTGGWWAYNYATPTLPDYPHCGVWNDAYVCGDNEGGAQQTLYAFDRANMLNGATARPAQRFASIPSLAGYGFQMITPSTFYGTNAAPAGRKQLVARHNDDEAHAGASADGTKDFLDLYEVNIDWNTPANSGVTTLPRIDITEFNSWFRNYSTFATVPQPGSTSRLDPIREALLNQLVYRNMGTHEVIVGTLATNQNPARTGTVVDSAVRWFELRRTGGGNWTLFQEGTFSPGDADTHHLMGTIAMDKFGNMAMAYNVTKTSTPTKFATLGYTGRTAADPAGVMSLGENEVAIGAAVETSGRWGDYYQMTVDPVDDCTFWFVGMYRPTGGWQTRIQDVKFSACSGITTYSVSGTIATAGGAGIGGVTVSTGSNSTTTNASGAYTLTGLTNGTYTLTPSLGAYTFSPATRSITIADANVTGQNFTGTAPPNVPPVANFTFTTSGLTANFTDTSTDSDGTIASRSWNFGDGSTSTATNPSKTYAAGGTYTVTLTVTDNVGATNTKTSSVTVVAPNVPPTANFTFTTSGLTANFTDTSTDSDGTIAARNWNFGDTTTSTATNPSKTYGGSGSYTVTLTVTDNSGATATKTSTVTVNAPGTQTYTNNTDYPINDNKTVNSPIRVTGRSGNGPTNTQVAVDIRHTYIGDLRVSLIAPDGTAYILHDYTGTSTDNIIRTYTVNLSTETLNGNWRLRVKDNSTADTGYINSWSITF
ncbi:MAG: proprotein convertase P-domain-containing protein [Lysobacter sp.]|nr:proprotein convertase P-domain-containing protein [Lysobacter sp.]